VIEFVEGSGMETRVFAVTPMEVWRCVYETGDVDVWWDWSEAGLEKEFGSTHRSSLGGGDI
jgi:hypothetical protein